MNPPLTQLTIEAGEGYRFLDPKTDKKQPGDERSDDLGKNWHPVSAYSPILAGASLYRRKLPPVDPDREERERIAREDAVAVHTALGRALPSGLLDEAIKIIHAERRAISGILAPASLIAAELDASFCHCFAGQIRALANRVSVDGRAEGEKV